MADSEHNVTININGNANVAVNSIGKVKSAFAGIVTAARNVTKALGFIHLALNAVNTLYNGFKLIKEKITETAREMAKLRFDIAMRAAAGETARLVGFHEKLSRLMKDELDTLAKQREIQDVEERGKKDYADGKREAERARQIFEAKTPEEEQALRDRFAAEDEQRARDERKQARKRQISNLDEEESVYTSKANGLRNNNRKINEQISDEEYNLLRATKEEDKKSIQARIDALKKRKEANEAEVEQFEKEARFLRDKIAAIEGQEDYAGPSAGEWNRKTEAKKRAQEAAEKEAEDIREEQRKAREKDDSANEFVNSYIEETRAENGRKADELDQFADRIDSADGVSNNRLTAMGLGSGVSANGDVTSDVRKIVDLLREQIAVQRESKNDGDVNVCVYGE